MNGECKWFHYLEGAWFEQHDLVILAELLEPWDPLGELYNLFHCRSEALRERFPYLLTWTLWSGHRPGIKWAGLREGQKTYNWCVLQTISRLHRILSVLGSLPALWILELISTGTRADLGCFLHCENCCNHLRCLWDLLCCEAAHSCCWLKWRRRSRYCPRCEMPVCCHWKSLDNERQGRWDKSGNSGWS